MMKYENKASNKPAGLRARRTRSRRGFVLAMVVVFIGVFFTMASFFYVFNLNQRPVIDKLDRGAIVEYMSQGLVEAIKLKIKEFPEEFRDCMREIEAFEKNNPGSNPFTSTNLPLAKAFFDEFRDKANLKNEYKIEIVDGEFEVEFEGVKRIYIGLPERQNNMANTEFINDVIQIALKMTYKDKTDNVVSRKYEASFDFKRKFAGN